jgi:Dolichyl-phosphate-mannose-protein mannosyltransferase
MTTSAKSLVTNRREALIGVAVILSLLALMVAAINPLHNFPMGDDFEYARTAQRLLTTGQFYRAPVVQATAFFPGVWGALFSLALGFSFTTLRLSTLPLAAGSLVAFYLILGELKFDAPRKLLGTLTLMVAPFFVFNALSFMTDVPFLFWVVTSVLCSLRAFRLGDLRWLVAGSVCAALAFLTRQLGLALPVAVAVVVLLYKPRGEWARWLAASMAMPVAVAAIYFVWQATTGQMTWADSTITDQGTLQFIFNREFPAAVARRVVIIMVTLSLYMLPLWVAFLPKVGHAWQAVGRLNGWLRAAAIGLVVFFFGSVTFFGLRNDWWPYSRASLSNAGLWPTLALNAFPNDVRTPFFSPLVWIGMTYLGTALAVLLTMYLVVSAARALRKPLGKNWARVQEIGAARALVYVTGLLLLGFVLVYTLFTERYFLPLLPFAIILLFEATRGVNPSFAFAGAALAAVGIFSIALMWDYFAWHEARWTQAQALVASGVPLEKIDAGYDWSGWYLSDEAYAYIQAHHVPLTASPVLYVIDPEYMVTFTPQPGYRVARELPFVTVFRAGGQDKLLLLQREGTP